MDSQKKTLILHWVSNVWGKKADSFFELTDGQFFHHVLQLLEQDAGDSTASSLDPFHHVQKYLEEHYGKDARIDKLLNFDLFGDTHEKPDDGVDVEMELGKITVFLLSLALFSAKGNQVVAAASLDLPVHMHGDIKTLVQAVVETQFADSSCSSTVEEVLKSPSGEEKSFDENSMKAFFEKPLRCDSLTPEELRRLREMSPIGVPVHDISASAHENHHKTSLEAQTSIAQNLYASRECSSSPPLRKEFSQIDPNMRSTPKYSKASSTSSVAFNASKMLPSDSPLPLNASTHNISFGISSPFRALNISASSLVSPLANFIQSPEIIQKVLLKKKDLELSKLKRELNNQVYISEDLQMTIQENIDTITSKDAEIEKLKARVKELHCLQDASDELEEIKPRLADLEATIEKLNGKLLKLDYYRSQCQILEKENSDQRDEMQQLHEEIKSLESEAGEKKELLLAKSQMEIQMKTLETQASELLRGKGEVEDECDVLRGKLAHTTQQYDQLHKEWEEMNVKNNDSAQGESMGVIVELQLGELKAHVEELTQSCSDFEEEVKALKASHTEKEREVMELARQLNEKEETVASLEVSLNTNEELLVGIKGELLAEKGRNEELEETVSKLNLNLEEEKSTAAEQRASHEALMSEKVEELSEVTEKGKELESRIETLSADLENVRIELLSEQVKNKDLMSDVSCKEAEVTSLKQANQDLQGEVDGLKDEIILVTEEKENMVARAADIKTRLDESKQTLETKEQELTHKEKMLQDMKMVVVEKEEQITSIEEKLATKESSVEELNVKINICEEEMMTMKGHITEKEAELEELQRNHAEEISSLEEKARLMADDKEALSHSLECKSANVEELNHQLSVTEEKLCAMQEERARVETALNELTDHVRSVEESSASTQARLELQDAENITMKETLAQKDRGIEQLLKEKEEQTLVLADVQSKLECSKDENASLSSQIEKLQAELAAMKETLIQRDADSGELLKEKEGQSLVLSDVQSKLECSLNENASLSSQLEKLHAELSAMKETLIQRDADNGELLKEKEGQSLVLSDVQSKLECSLNENASLSSQIEKLQAELAAMKETLIQRDADSGELLKEKEGQSLVLSDVQSKLECSLNENASLSSQIEKLQAELAAMKETLIQRDADSGELLKEKEGQSLVLSDVQSKLECSETENASLSSQVKNLQKKVEALTCAVKEKDHHQEENVKQLEVMAETVSNLHSEIEQKSLEIEELNSQKESILLKATSYESQLRETQAKIESLKSDVENKATEMDRLKEEKEDAAKEIDSLQTQIASLQKKEEDVSVEHENVVSQLQCDLEAKTTLISSLQLHLEENLSKTELERQSSNTEIESRSAEINRLYEQISSLNNVVAERDEKISAQATEKSEICVANDAKMKELEAEISELNKCLSSRDVELKDLNCVFQEKVEAFGAAQDKNVQLDAFIVKLEDKVTRLEEKLKEKASDAEGMKVMSEKKDAQLEEHIEKASEDKRCIEELKDKIESLVKEHGEEKWALENSLMEKESLATQLEEKSNELQELVQEKDQLIRNLESQLSSLKAEISKSNTDIQSKEEEIKKLDEECREKSFQLAGKESELGSLMAQVSNDKAVKDEQLCSLTAQVQEKELLLSTKDEEIDNLTEKINSQDVMMSKLTADVERNRECLSDLEVAKLEAETAASRYLEELEESKELAARLSEELRQNEERGSELTLKLKEEFALLQQQVEVIGDKDKVIGQLNAELAALSEVNSKLDQKERELISLIEERRAMEDKHVIDVSLLQEEKEFAISDIIRCFNDILEWDDSDEDIEFVANGDGAPPPWLERVEEIKAKYQSVRTERDTDLIRRAREDTEADWMTRVHELHDERDYEKRQELADRKMEVENARKETEALWTKKVSELEAAWTSKVDELTVAKEKERVSERANHEVELEKRRQETEVLWTRKVNELEVEMTEARQAEFVKHKKEIVDLRESITAEWEEKLDSLQAKFDAELKREVERLEKEKERLQGDLNSGWQDALSDLQVKFEAAKASEMQAQSRQKAELLEMKETYEAKLTAQRMESDKLLKSVHEENTKLLERETIHLKNTETQMKTANEYCNSLKKQVEAATAKMASLDQEILSLKEAGERHAEQMAKIRETNESLNSALQIERGTNAKMQQRMESHITRHNSSKALLEKAQQENKSYVSEIHKLKTTVDYSERKLQEYKHQLDNASTAFLGDSSHFQRLVQERDNMMDDSLMQKDTPKSKYNLRSSTEMRQDIIASPNDTIISADVVMLKRETLTSSGADLPSKQIRTPSSRMSISSTSSSQSVKSLNGLPPGMRPNMQSCANEPEEFEWDRLSELQRRNTLCLPHMKSSYPVEVQTVKKDKFSDDSLRLSLMPKKKVEEKTESDTSRLGKRKPQGNSKTTDTTSPKQQKAEISPGGTVVYFPLAKDGPIYPPSRPLTPGKLRRHSRTPKSSPRTTGRHKIVGSMVARRKQHTPSPRKSPRLNPKSPAVRNGPDHENKPHESVAFSIGFTPDKADGLKRMLRKKKSSGFDVTSTAMSAKKGLAGVKQLVKEKVRRPLATRNFRETGI